MSALTSLPSDAFLRYDGRRVVTPELRPEYRAWWNMIRRCHYPSHANYQQYGARGIAVCAEWRESFWSFLDHIGRKPTRRHSIDRIDNDGNYEPGNVRWATAEVQAANSRPPRAHGRHSLKPGPTPGLERLLIEANLRHREVADVLGVSTPGVSTRLAGKSNWRLDELVLMAETLSQRLGRQITLNDLVNG
jgi:hypothetical protein